MKIATHTALPLDRSTAAETARRAATTSAKPASSQALPKQLPLFHELLGEHAALVHQPLTGPQATKPVSTPPSTTPTPAPSTSTPASTTPSQTPAAVPAASPTTAGSAAVPPAAAPTPSVPIGIYGAGTYTPLYDYGNQPVILNTQAQTAQYYQSVGAQAASNLAQQQAQYKTMPDGSAGFYRDPTLVDPHPDISAHIIMSQGPAAYYGQTPVPANIQNIFNQLAKGADPESVSAQLQAALPGINKTSAT